MPAKLTATLLLLLVLSPCTAPFSTCDLAALFAAAPDSATAAASRRLLTPHTAETSVSQVRPLSRSAGRVKLVALSGPNAVLAVERGAASATINAVAPAIAAPCPALSVLRI